MSRVNILLVKHPPCNRRRPTGEDRPTDQPTEGTAGTATGIRYCHLTSSLSSAVSSVVGDWGISIAVGHLVVYAVALQWVSMRKDSGWWSWVAPHQSFCLSFQGRFNEVTF